MDITDVNTLFGAYPSKHPVGTAEGLAAVLKAQGVQWCLSLSTYGLFANDRDGNIETLAACRAIEQLIPVATMNPKDYLGQPDMIAAIVQAPFEMFRFFPHLQGWPIDFVPFSDILAMLTAHGPMPIMVSIEDPGDITALARVVQEYRAPVIMEGVSGKTLGEAICVMRRADNLFIETHAIHVPDALPLLRDTVGIRRVLFGSNAPGRSLAAALRYVQRSGLSEEDRAAVLGGNAHAIWHSQEGGA
jgi:hypothetical protein